MSPEILEIGCRSVLNRSRIPGIDYTVNPYTGCLHGCLYCYAQHMRSARSVAKSWGHFCHVKINAASRFRKQILTARPGLISLSTATDPYQSVEKKYRLTRQILCTLKPLRFSVSILTKSDLILRDQEILRQLTPDRCEIGFSLNTCDDATAHLFEPGAPSPSRRIRAMQTLHAAGIRTWLFVAPVLPFFTPDTIESLFASVRGSVDYIQVDRFNTKHGTDRRMAPLIQSRFPDLFTPWLNILQNPKTRHAYYHEIFSQIGALGKQMDMDVRFCGQS